MTRTDPPRARRAAPGRVRGFTAVLMIVFALAASVLVSAGSAHHARPAATSVTTMHGEAAGVSPATTGHDHEHGTDWAPTLGKRLRPAAAAAVGTLPARPYEPGTAPDTGTVPTGTAPGDRLISVSVLRV